MDYQHCLSHTSPFSLELPENLVSVDYELIVWHQI